MRRQAAAAGHTAILVEKEALLAAELADAEPRPGRWGATVGAVVTGNLVKARQVGAHELLPRCSSVRSSVP
jgi:hypothetical protein